MKVLGENLLEVRDLTTYFYTRRGVVKAVDGVSFSIGLEEAVGLVGESGCGKTVTALSIMQLLKCPPAKIVKGEVLLKGEDLLKLSPRAMRRKRGNEISMIFQDPLTYLNPIMRVGEQVAEAIMLHQKVDKEEALEGTVRLFERVGIPEPEKRINNYPFEFSGGMRQRVLIAMALSCKPDLLIADEPTTALDVTIQAQILDLIQALRREYKMALMLITHNFGVIAENCEKIMVMYAGNIVEIAESNELFDNPIHPYTVGLMNCLPQAREETAKLLQPISGQVPSLIDMPEECHFAPRCPRAGSVCRKGVPKLIEAAPGHMVACVKASTSISADVLEELDGEDEV